MESFLIFARRHTAFVFGIAIAAGLSGLLLVSRVSFDANILRLLPQRSPSVRDFQLFLRNFGSLDHLYVVFETAGAIGDHGELVDRYVEALRRAPEIESVDAQLFEPGKDWSYLSDRELYLLGADGAGAALARFRPPQLDGEIAHARDLLSMPSAQIKALVQQDPLGLLTMLRDRMGREKGVVSFDPTQEGYVSRDGRRRLVVVKPNGAPFDTDFCKALFKRLSAVEATARREAAAEDPDASAVSIQAAGAYRVSLEAEQLIRREGIVNSIGSLLLLLLVVFAVFRTPWVMLYGCAPLALAAVLTLGINGLIQGSLSPATSGSAGMLFGLGIDGVVLLYLRYLEERRAGASPDEAVRHLGGTASSVVLAQMTTAATFFALLLIDFPSLQDLGSLVGLGILLCCGLTLLLLPAMLPRHTDGRRERGLTAAWLGRFVTRAARPIVWVSAIATIALAAASTRLHLDTSIDKLQAQTRGAVLEKEVADQFALPRDVLLVLNEHEDIQPLLETEARLERALSAEAPSVVASGIGVLLPSAREQMRVAQVIRAARTTSSDVQGAIRAAAARTGFRPDTFVPFLERVPRLLDPNERITYDGLMTHGLESIVSRFVVRRDGRYQAVTYLYSQQTVDIDALRRIVRDVDPRLRLTGLPAINHELRRQFFPQFLKGIAIGTVAVALLVYIVFRTVRHTLLALLPTAVGFIWSAGALALLRVELDLFSLFAAVTFIGIAVDYGIYVLYRYVFEPSRGMDDVMTRTGAAIMIA
ncbi:MAG TPA: MMPL family transporter, partial [Vicinamibacterales bacterium]|nr:MMPL family transporter [Vicinamibacterales bacterium]